MSGSWFFSGASGKPSAPVSGSLPRLTADGRIFRQNGQPFRWRGVSAFGLLNRFAKGDDIGPFLDAYAGFNLVRVFLWVPVADWKDRAWGIPPLDSIHAFLDDCAARGFYVELTLLTGPRPNPQALVTTMVMEFRNHENLLIELVNEPDIYDKPDTSQLTVPPTQILWTSGDYVRPEKMRGNYGVAHTGRDGDWPRRAHDLMEYREGGGPWAPFDPPHHFPIIADEPIRPDQANYDTRDYLAHFAACSLFGGGATFHCETGKYGDLPTTAEAMCAAAALEGLTAFPEDAPLGGYRRLDDSSSRTYALGSCMVRVRPTTLNPPEAGWTPLDPSGIIWRRS